MNRTQTACFALLASAFILAAILIVRLDQKADSNAAMASGQNVKEQSFQVMTARTRGGINNPDESLFVLDNSKGILVVYSIKRNKLEPVKAFELKDVFGGR